MKSNAAEKKTEITSIKDPDVKKSTPAAIEEKKTKSNIKKEPTVK